MKQFGRNLLNEQEVMINITDMMMETYLSESLALRIEKLEIQRGVKIEYRDILDVNIYDTAGKVRKSAADAVYSVDMNDSVAGLINAIELLSKVNGVNVKESRRRIADKLIADNMYKF